MAIKEKNLDKHFQGSIKYCFHFFRIGGRLECFLFIKYANNRNHSQEVLQRKTIVAKPPNGGEPNEWLTYNWSCVTQHANLSYANLALGL